jgi:hypothetical protein
MKFRIWSNSVRTMPQQIVNAERSTANVEHAIGSAASRRTWRRQTILLRWHVRSSITSTIANRNRRGNKSKIANRQRNGGEGGIRTLGSLLGYGALAKRCFQPLSHLTKNRLQEYREEMWIANIDIIGACDLSELWIAA